jgi:hypothetical protein
MKLQIKDSGAWRNVVNFEPHRQAEVLKAGAYLLTAMAPTKTVLRVVDGEKTLSYCQAPSYTWLPA